MKRYIKMKCQKAYTPRRILPLTERLREVILLPRFCGNFKQDIPDFLERIKKTHGDKTHRAPDLPTL